MRPQPFSKKNLFSATAWKIRLVLWGGAILVGVAATLFAKASDWADRHFDEVTGDRPWLPLLLVPGGLMLVTWLTRRFFPGAQGSGIPQTLAAMEVRTRDGLRERILSLRIAFGKMLLTVVGLFCGASIGREGPTVHVGAAIMFSLGRSVRFPPHYMERALILAGGAAGISAAFNTPLAGIVFAIEEISRSFEERANGVVLTAVVLAGMTALAIQGNYNYFGSTPAQFATVNDWLAVPICGVLGGLLGGLFSQALIVGSNRLAPLYRAYPLRVAAVCGLVVALVGLAAGGTTYGTGYLEAKAILMDGSDAEPGYGFLKMLATTASYLSGVPGGIFAPSLSAGAGLGADLARLLPELSASAVVVLAMVGYFTGVVQTPITAFVIVMEMTDHHDILLPLMATAFIAFSVSRLVCPQPIYRSLAAAFLGSQPQPPAPAR